MSVSGTTLLKKYSSSEVVAIPISNPSIFVFGTPKPYTTIIGGSAMNSQLFNQMKASTDGKLLASALAKVYMRSINEPYSTPEGTKLAEENLQMTGPSEGFKDCWDTVNDSIRVVTQAVMDEQALQPLRSLVTSSRPQYDKLKGARNAALLDFDANRRRLQAAKEKREDAMRKGTHVGDAQITTDAKIEKLETKKTVSGTTYENVNEDLKRFCIETKTKHDELMDELVINTAVCQLEYYKRSAAELQQVVDTLPQHRVTEITERIDELMQAGGHILAAHTSRAPEKRKSMLDGFASAFNFGGGPVSGKPPAADAVARTTEEGSNANPFDEPEEEEAELPPAAPSAPAPPTPVSAAPKKSRFVTAMYDHDAEESDELSFKVGDVVEVLETGEGGWWSGRCNGQIGDFPVDFVDTSNFSM